MADLVQEHCITPINENSEVICWGCGLRLLIPSHSPVFKCGWCGAVTNQNARKRDGEYLLLRRWRDRCFVCVLLLWWGVGSIPCSFLHQLFQWYIPFHHYIYPIGNCVGAANHRYFIAFLISAVISMIYVTFMSTYAGLYVWPPLSYRAFGRIHGYSSNMASTALKEVMLALLRSAALLSARGLILVYLFVSSVSVEIGLSILLWQQLCYIYEGKTYLNSLSSHRNNDIEEKGCQNIWRFFGCPHSFSRILPSFRKKILKKR
ncbi:hypothetical protein F8388_004746 [Cannabis sativa]|uniref:S-acyltransferase n=1 Tax=Cannabis sativa TaxID=3483 RepID=A0A7J6I6T4_CANSA|nr:hypothetical protein F8388_015677 [Cannabis sativa]KAF4396778.1 hypothetical protein F8388_004746 [Cannabis sativa]KAF4403006.1 hypothetical protein G4B88_010458 [Cannabis sativa]